MIRESRGKVVEVAESKISDAELSDRGVLVVYSSQDKLDLHVADLKGEAGQGVPHRVLGGSECREMEPSLSKEIVGGILLEKDAWLNPSKFLLQMRELAAGMGGRVVGDDAADVRVENGRILGVRVGEEEVKAQDYVFALGAYSTPFLSKIGVNLPVAPGWGHRITFEPTEKKLNGPLQLGDHKISVSQTSEGSVRASSFFELSTIHYTPPESRYELIKKKTALSIPFVENLALADKWSGMRPCTPDGLPIIGRPSRISNLVLAVGHCRKGLLLSSATGRMVKEILRSGAKDVHPLLSPARFGL